MYYQLVEYKTKTHSDKVSQGVEIKRYLYKQKQDQFVEGV